MSDITHSLLSSSATICVVIALVVAMPHTATAALMLDGDADELCTNDGSYGQYTFGNMFTVGTAPLEVTRLGYADRVDGDGLTDSHQVGIWDASSEALLTSVTVPSGTSATLLNDFRWITLDTPLTLAANTAYVIGGDSGPGPTAADTFRFRLPNEGELGPGFVVDVEDCCDRRQSAKGAGFVFPTEVGSNDPNEVWASVNMEYTVMSLILPGDANLDDAVDVSDLGILATNYGATSGKEWGDGDFTGDGAVDVSDLGILATNYGTTAAAASSVPEPSVVMLLAGIVLSIVLVRRR